MYLLKKKYPYNYNEKKHKIHLSDREINTIRTVIVATFLASFYTSSLHPLEFCSSVSR